MFQLKEDIKSQVVRAFMLLASCRIPIEKMGVLSPYFRKIWKCTCVKLAYLASRYEFVFFCTHFPRYILVCLLCWTPCDSRYPFEAKFLAEVSQKICNSVRAVNRVSYDITSKPPSTIEWEWCHNWSLIIYKIVNFLVVYKLRFQ